jgi:hypothetical protein
MFDPNDPEVAARMQQQEQAPDPELVEVQEKMALEREKAEFQAELDLFRMQNQAELEAMRIEGQIDIQAYRASVEARLAEMKAVFEMRNKLAVSRNRAGGDLDK